MDGGGGDGAQVVPALTSPVLELREVRSATKRARAFAWLVYPALAWMLVAVGVLLLAAGVN